MEENKSTSLKEKFHVYEEPCIMRAVDIPQSTSADGLKFHKRNKRNKRKK